MSDRAFSREDYVALAAHLSKESPDPIAGWTRQELEEEYRALSLAWADLVDRAQNDTIAAKLTQEYQVRLAMQHANALECDYQSVLTERNRWRRDHAHAAEQARQNARRAHAWRGVALYAFGAVLFLLGALRAQDWLLALGVVVVAATVAIQYGGER